MRLHHRSQSTHVFFWCVAKRHVAEDFTPYVWPGLRDTQVSRRGLKNLESWKGEARPPSLPEFSQIFLVAFTPFTTFFWSYVTQYLLDAIFIIFWESSLSVLFCNVQFHHNMGYQSNHYYFINYSLIITCRLVFILSFSYVMLINNLYF